MSAKKGDYREAINYYEEAISRAQELDANDEDIADYQYNIALIYFSNLKNYPQARAYARQSLSSKEDQGRCYIVIGLCYAASQPYSSADYPAAKAAILNKTVFWAAVDKFAQAKRVEPTCAADADKLISTYSKYFPTKEEMFEFIKAHSIPCPHCGKHNFTDIREFNLMFQTYRGVTNDAKSVIYLRPENAQGEYVNFLNVQRSMRAKLPFSIGQIGKAFRNEITPGNFTFRTIEFEQMEFQTFCKKGSDNELYDYFKQFGKKYFEDLGIAPEHLRFHDHEKLAHYAKAACDIEFLFPFGWGEINGTHNRTDFDLTRHQEYSGQKMDYLDPETNEKFIPYIIESTYGLDRTVLALLCEAYDEEVIDAEKNDTRVVLHLSPVVAPYKAAVLPLSKKLSGEAVKICDELSRKFMVDFDETGSIGKRYRRQDEIGTPLCITFDFDSVEDHCVTVRDRDTMKQERIAIDELESYIASRIEF